MSFCLGHCCGLGRLKTYGL